jgi:drug/metabolite transporter (DMT)-like permease
MIGNPRTRRVLSLALMVLGGILLFLAPQDVWVGVLLLGLGVALEVVGTLMQRRAGDKPSGKT